MLSHPQLPWLRIFPCTLESKFAGSVKSDTADCHERALLVNVNALQLPKPVALIIKHKNQYQNTRASMHLPVNVTPLALIVPSSRTSG